MRPTAKRCVPAIPCGYRHVTHLYSAMSTIVRKAASATQASWKVRICTMSCPARSSPTAATCPLHCCSLPTDTSARSGWCWSRTPCAAPDRHRGESILGSLENGQRVILEDGVAKMPDRTAFAGSICTADRLVRTMVTLAGASLPDAVRMITETPARVLGLSDFYGRVEAGRAADLAVFDHTVRIAMVFKDGAVCFENREEAFQ